MAAFRERSALTLAVPVALAFLSCTTPPTKTASTPSRTYKATPERVYEAAIVAFQNLGLEVFKQDHESGYVEGGRRPGFQQGSETVGVFIQTTTDGATEVFIDNRKAAVGIVFAVDWTDKLFHQIDRELRQ